MSTLKEGSTGYEVYILHRNLNILGYPVPITGTFGAETDTLVREFQKAKGLTVDGIVGEIETWPLMDSMVRHGIDLYDGSGAVDFGNWCARHKFAICKCSQGKSGKQSRFAGFVAALKQLNVETEAYHWVTLDAAAEQVANIVSVLPKGMRVWLDCEDQVAESSTAFAADNTWIANNPSGYTNLVLAILAGLKAAGIAAGIYSYKTYIEQLGTANSVKLMAYPFWVSAQEAQLPGLPPGCAKFDTWQWDVAQTPPCVPGDSDSDLRTPAP
jgi:peptidoglycan hydrolase-like protein with peptidoglycan-binding domain